MITNGLAEEHWHSIQAKFYAILTKNGNYTRIFVGDTFGQSVSKVMTHLTVFGEFSSIPNLCKTSPPSPLHNVDQTRNDHSAAKSDQHWLGGRGEIWQTLFFFSCGATFIKKIPKFCRVCHEFCNRLSEMVRGGSHEKYSVYRFGILTSDVVSLFASFYTISGAIH